MRISFQRIQDEPLQDHATPLLISQQRGAAQGAGTLPAEVHIKRCTSARDPGKLAVSPPGIQLQGILTEVLSWKLKRGWREEGKRKRGRRGSQPKHGFPACPHRK